jgi:hypothetical protein
MDSFNENPDISPLIPLTYSMLINKTTSKETVFDLQKLVTEFKVDATFDGNGVVVKNVPAFVSKSFYQIQNLDKPDKLDFSYNFPPKGPIEPDFVCPYCGRSGPSFHTENCRRPFNESLILEKPSSRFPGATEGARYEMIVKKSGQKKIVSKRARSQTFPDLVELVFQNKNEQQAIVRISRNGTLNIISASANETDLGELLVYRINQTSAVKNKPYIIETANKYLVFSQFNLFPIQYQDTALVVLHTLHNTLWNIPIFKKVVDSKTAFVVRGQHYFVSGYNYNSGDQLSRSNKMTNSFIQFVLTKQPGIKIHVQIYKRGAVQLRGSRLENSNTPLEFSVLDQAYLFLRELFSQVIVYSHQAEYDIIESEFKKPKKSKIPNMVDGRQPQVCQNHKSKKGDRNVRPIPYSFYGVCPMPGYYVAPRGVRRPDGKIEPCCYKLKDDDSSPDSIKRWENIKLNGYPDDKADFFGETVTPGDSAVFVPGTKIVQPRSFPGLNNMSKKQLLDCMESKGYITRSGHLEKNKVNVSVPRMNFKRIKTLITFTPFTKNIFMVTPIRGNTVRVKLYFNEYGKSFFINTLGQTSESGIPDTPSLAQTILDGHFYPFPNLVFYPFDCDMYKGKDTTGLMYYSGQQKRWDYVKIVEMALRQIESNVSIVTEFDLNIIGGSHNYLTDDGVHGLLFISVSSNEMYTFYDSFHEYNLIVGLEAQQIQGNRWRITVENKTLPESLVQQGPNNDIELPVAFTKGKGNSFIAAFKINFKQTDYKIENTKPFIPQELLDEQINTYQEVVGILESINSPITRETFQAGNSIQFNGKVFTFVGYNSPLIVN